MSKKHFEWRSDSKPPNIRAHSLAKLSVIEQYVINYLKTLTCDPRIDNLSISFVDTFCGGGIYTGIRELEYGSPLRLIHAVKAAEAEIAQSRKKPFRILADFFLSDVNRLHVASLRQTIESNGFVNEIGRSIHISTGLSSAILRKVIPQIRSSSNRRRAIFVLDQFGYKDVSIDDLQFIFESLPNAEVIWTFSIDALINYLTAKRPLSPTLAQFGVDEEFIRRWSTRDRGNSTQRQIIQKLLMQSLYKRSGAKFFTPFILYSPDENREILLVHLSQHQKARDKMLSVHWDRQNSFRHYGRGSFFTLGFDPRQNDYENTLFSFRDYDKCRMLDELLVELPSHLYRLMNDGEVPVASLLDRIGNRTAAQNDDVFRVIRNLVIQKELIVYGPKGELRRPTTMPKIGDRIVRPNQLVMSFPAI